MNHIRFLSIFTIIFVLVFCAGYAAFAEQDSKDSELRSAVSKSSENSFTEEFKKNPPKRVRQFVYEIATIETLAYVHWGLSIFDLSENLMDSLEKKEAVNSNIDNFLKITECDIYNKFKGDEFEWEKIRNATKENIRKNKIDFPVRFELAIPLKLARYDTERSVFELDSKNIIRSSRLFELPAVDYSEPVCGDDKILRNIGDYYNAFMIQLSRPFSLTVVPVERSKAQKIIEQANEKFQKVLERSGVTNYQEEDVFSYREAYLFLYIKIFTYRGPFEGEKQQGFKYGQVLSVLDGYEVFADPRKKNLLYSRNYMTKTDVVKQNDAMLKELEIIKTMLKNKGMLAGRPEEENL